MSASETVPASPSSTFFTGGTNTSRPTTPAYPQPLRFSIDKHANLGASESVNAEDGSDLVRIKKWVHQVKVDNSEHTQEGDENEKAKIMKWTYIEKVEPTRTRRGRGATTVRNSSSEPMDVDAVVAEETLYANVLERLSTPVADPDFHMSQVELDGNAETNRNRVDDDNVATSSGSSLFAPPDISIAPSPPTPPPPPPPVTINKPRQRPKPAIPKSPVYRRIRNRALGNVAPSIAPRNILPALPPQPPQPSIPPVAIKKPSLYAVLLGSNAPVYGSNRNRVYDDDDVAPNIPSTLLRPLFTTAPAKPFGHLKRNDAIQNGENDSYLRIYHHARGIPLAPLPPSTLPVPTNKPRLSTELLNPNVPMYGRNRNRVDDDSVAPNIPSSLLPPRDISLTWPPPPPPPVATNKPRPYAVLLDPNVPVYGRNRKRVYDNDVAPNTSSSSLPTRDIPLAPLLPPPPVVTDRTTLYAKPSSPDIPTHRRCFGTTRRCATRTCQFLCPPPVQFGLTEAEMRRLEAGLMTKVEPQSRTREWVQAGMRLRNPSPIEDPLCRGGTGVERVSASSASAMVPTGEPLSGTSARYVSVHSNQEAVSTARPPPGQEWVQAGMHFRNPFPIEEPLRRGGTGVQRVLASSAPAVVPNREPLRGTGARGVSAHSNQEAVSTARPPFGTRAQVDYPGPGRDAVPIFLSDLQVAPSSSMEDAARRLSVGKPPTNQDKVVSHRRKRHARATEPTPEPDPNANPRLLPDGTIMLQCELPGCDKTCIKERDIASLKVAFTNHLEKSHVPRSSTTKLPRPTSIVCTWPIKPGDAPCGTGGSRTYSQFNPFMRHFFSTHLTLAGLDADLTCLLCGTVGSRKDSMKRHMKSTACTVCPGCFCDCGTPAGKKQHLAMCAEARIWEAEMRREEERQPKRKRRKTVTETTEIEQVGTPTVEGPVQLGTTSRVKEEE